MAEPPGDRILVTGALGQIGSDLVEALRTRHGTDKVIASDVREVPGHPFLEDGPSASSACSTVMGWMLL